MGYTNRVTHVVTPRLVYINVKTL